MLIWSSLAKKPAEFRSAAIDAELLEQTPSMPVFRVQGERPAHVVEG